MTRDIDLLIRPEDTLGLEHTLAQQGFRQLGGQDLDSGVGAVVPAKLRQEWEADKHEYWPWRVHFAAEALAYAKPLVETLGEAALPLVILKGRVVVECEVDLHHSMWPKLAYSRLKFGPRPFGVTSLQRLHLPDQVLLGAVRAAGEVTAGKLNSLGALSQVVTLIERHGTSELPAACMARAEAFELVEEWRGAAAVFHALFGRWTGDDPRYPASTPSDVEFAKGRLLEHPQYRLEDE